MLDLWELNVSKLYRHGFTIEGREGAPSQSSSMPSTNGAHSAAIVHNGSDDFAKRSSLIKRFIRQVIKLR